MSSAPPSPPESELETDSEPQAMDGISLKQIGTVGNGDAVFAARRGDSEDQRIILDSGVDWAVITKVFPKETKHHNGVETLCKKMNIKFPESFAAKVKEIDQSVRTQFMTPEKAKTYSWHHLLDDGEMLCSVIVYGTDSDATTEMILLNDLGHTSFSGRSDMKLEGLRCRVRLELQCIEVNLEKSYARQLVKIHAMIVVEPPLIAITGFSNEDIAESEAAVKRMKLYKL